jgi:predicted permease
MTESQLDKGTKSPERSMHDWHSEVRARLAQLKLKPEREADIVDEIAQHLAERYREATQGGAAPEEATRLALAEFRAGNALAQRIAALKQARVPPAVTLGASTGHVLADLQQDLRYAARRLAASRAFTAAAIVTIALGVGANAAIFGVAKSVLLDSLPYTDPDRLVQVYGGLRDDARARGPLTAGTIADIAARQQSFTSMAAFSSAADVVFGGAEGSRVAQAAWVEPGFFDMLGVRVAEGRGFRAEDAGSGLAALSGGAEGVDTGSVLVTHSAWQRLLSGDPDIIGRKVVVSGVSRTVIGVLPRDFIGPVGAADFYFAFDLAPVATHPVAGRRSGWLGLIARLKPGGSEAAASSEIETIWTQMRSEHPEDITQALGALPLREALVGDTRTPLVVLLASAALVLLVACANLAGVQLSRALSRRREFAVRLALGAGRARIVRQVLSESVLLGLAGGAAGLLLAMLALTVLRELVAPSLPSHAELSLDGAAIVVGTCVALVAGFAFGVAPALAIAATDPQATLREEARGASETRRSRALRGALVACQLALCVSLLAGAGLLGRSLWAMSSAPLGFARQGVLTATVRLPPREYATPQARAAFYDSFGERLRSLPGVTDVARANALPTTVGQRMSIAVDGVVPADQAEPFVLFTAVSDNYFRLLEIPLQRGRVFDERDVRDAPPTAIISESAARRFWPGGDALGARVRIGPDRASPLIEIVGIVGDVRNDRARADAEPMVYVPTRRNAPFLSRYLLRADGDLFALARSAERELAALDGLLALENATLLTDVVGQGLVGRQLPTVLIGAFGALALLVASVGVYAMFASMVLARQGEFAVRMALGSRPAAIARLVLRQGAGWMTAGLVGGLIGLMFVARLLSGLLYGVSPFDPIALGGAIAMLMACATVALLIPLRRAAAVQPAIVLRSQ